MKPCRTLRTGDTVYCTVCKRSWDHGDEPDWSCNEIPQQAAKEPVQEIPPGRYQRLFHKTTKR